MFCIKKGFDITDPQPSGLWAADTSAASYIFANGKNEARRDPTISAKTKATCKGGFFAVKGLKQCVLPPASAAAQLPEGHGTGGGHVQRIHPVAHGDAYGVVAVGNGLVDKAIPLGAQHNGQPFLLGQAGVLHADGAVGEGHGGRFEAQLAQLFHARVGPLVGCFANAGPGHLEHRTHADPHRTAAQGVAAGGRQQHCVKVQGGGRAHDGPHIGGIGNAFQHGYAVGVLAKLLHRGQGRAAQGAQHPAGQLIAGQAGQHLAVGGIQRNIAAAGHNIGGLAGDVVAFHQQGQGLVAGGQCQPDDLGAFGNKNALFRLQAVAQLGLGQAGKQIQLGRGKIGNFNDVGHGSLLGRMIFTQYTPAQRGLSNPSGPFLPLRPIDGKLNMEQNRNEDSLYEKDPSFGHRRHHCLPPKPAGRPCAGHHPRRTAGLCARTGRALLY